MSLYEGWAGRGVYNRAHAVRDPQRLTQRALCGMWVATSRVLWIPQSDENCRRCVAVWRKAEGPVR